MMKIIFGIFCCASILGSVLFAAHPLTTDDIGTVEIGKYE